MKRVTLEIGVDMVEIGPLARLVRKSPTFVLRTFSSRELRAADRLPEARREEYLAGRFAVKEAALKALGVGLTRDLRLTEIETLGLSSGAPRLVLRGRVSDLARRIGVRELRVSISHERRFAVAFVMLLSQKKSAIRRELRLRGIEGQAERIGGKHASLRETF